MLQTQMLQPHAGDELSGTSLSVSAEHSIRPKSGRSKEKGGRG